MNMKFFLGNSVSLVEGDTDCELMNNRNYKCFISNLIKHAKKFEYIQKQKEISECITNIDL